MRGDGAQTGAAGAPGQELLLVDGEQDLVQVRVGRVVAQGVILAAGEKASARGRPRHRCASNSQLQRSALNTAKLIDGNPTLMRLKELDGLDGLLSQAVKMKM